MTKTLKIEVTEAMLDLVDTEQKAWFERMVANCENEDWEPEDLWRCVLTAAFQHPEFVRQIREQVGAQLEETPLHYIGGVRYINEDEARASLGRLLGEES